MVLLTLLVISCGGAAPVLPIEGRKSSELAFMFEFLSSVMLDNPLLEPVLLHKETQPIPPDKKSAARVTFATISRTASWRLSTSAC